MKADSARKWRDFLSRYPKIDVYTVDPGAHAIALELIPLMRELGNHSGWFAEGWSKAHQADCRPPTDLAEKIGPGSTLLVGSQTDFARTQSVLREAASKGAITIFVFDHWKNYAEHFGKGALADAIIVPDAIAREHFLAAVGDHTASRVHVLPHAGLEAAAERVAAFGEVVEGDTVALLLDPTEPADGLGYDWRSSLTAAFDAVKGRKGMRLVVQPHPRQDRNVIKDAIAALDDAGGKVTLCTAETERLIASAREVWGMTTIALNVALAAGKPIRSFQIGRNDAGRRASNPHIEPFAIVR